MAESTLCRHLVFFYHLSYILLSMLNVFFIKMFFFQYSLFKYICIYVQGVLERRYHFYRSICKKTIDARNMKFSANYWYRPHNTLVPISRLYVNFLLNSKLKYEFRSYFQQWPLANKAMPPLITKRYLTTILLK